MKAQSLTTTAILLVCSLLSACSSRISNTALPDLVNVHSVDPLEKVFRETAVFRPHDPVAHAARGEHATLQYVIRSQANVSRLRCSITTLTNGADTLTGIRVGYVGYVPVGRNYPNPSRDRLTSLSGFYPDPLLETESIDVEANQSQPVWITVTVPVDAAPGLYSGQIVVQGHVQNKSFEERLPIRVQVYPVTVGKTSLWVTNWFFNHPGTLKLVYGEDVEPYSEKYWAYMTMLARKMAEYRQNVALISPLHLASYKIKDGRYEIDFTNFDKTVDIFIREKVIGRIEGGHIGGREGGWLSNFVLSIPVLKNDSVQFKSMPLESDTAKAFLESFIPALHRHLQEKGWDDIYMQHLMDEPIPENVETYIAIAEFVRSLAPGLKIVEACHSKDVQNTVSVWVPQLDYLSRDLDFYKERSMAGDEVWFYTCVNPRGEYANRFIDLPLIKTRILHWINYRYDIPGYLHWGFNYWNDNPYNETATIQLESGNVLPGGDSWIVYPAKGKILSSIRLEAMRDGIVDYELLKMLEEKYPAESAELARQVVYRFDHYDLNIGAFRNKRKRILSLLSSDTHPSKDGSGGR